MYQIIMIHDSQQLEQAFHIRRRVFIDEQHVPEELEMDDYDHQADTRHILLLDDQGQAAGTARFRPYGGGVLKIERVAVMANQRGQGAGRRIMEAIEAEGKREKYDSLKLSAQLHAKSFYEGLGYQAKGPIYLDAGIEHVDMFKQISQEP